MKRKQSKIEQQAKANIEQVLFGVRVGNEDWQEELITNNPERIEAAKAWAKANGFDRLRVATINLSEKPDFTKTVKKL